MAGWTHIALTGTSVATNAQKLGVIREGLQDLERKLAGGAVDREELASRLLNLVMSDPKGVSAELNTFLDLLDEGYLRGRQQWVYLLFSDTHIGALCADVVKRCIEQLSKEKYDGTVSAKTVKVEMLGSPERFEDGLANLFSTITDIIRGHKKKGDSVFVHATGGFKPEAAIAVLAANSPGTGAPVFYVHEHLRRVIRIPAMPVKFRQWGELVNLIGYLVSIGSANRAAIERMYGKIVDEAIKLGWAEEKEGEIHPTRMGETMWKQNEEVWIRKKKA